MDGAASAVGAQVTEPEDDAVSVCTKEHMHSGHVT